PGDAGRRLLLAELLCFTGDLERADKQLDALGHADAGALPAVMSFRQLIRAEKARQEFFDEGRLPTFLGRPEGAARLLLEAAIRVREGAPAEAASILDRAEAERPRVSGVCDDHPFDDFRDLDDLTSCILEVLTVNGEYYWVPISSVDSIEFQAPARPPDLLWRRAHLTVRGGPEGDVFLPALYPGAARQDDDQVRLGRLTDWRGGDGEPVRGVGQRVFLVGTRDRPILELQTITFDAPETPAPAANPAE
ncbi:MAG: SciE type virulence protein, partial [Planctomycetia bacterium]|nr:SciE type virulence protein [Planctomycetia bacterium]